MIVLGVTGGIGCGKSTVSKIFESLGCVVFNSDLEAREILNSQAIRKDLLDMFGPELLSGGEIDRKRIASKVFNDAEMLSKLNYLIHPAVAAKFSEFKQKNQNAIIIKEAAILFETGTYRQNDKNLLVVAPKHARMQRVMARDGISELEFERRLANQWPDEKKIPLADFVIDNEGEKFLIPQVMSVYQELKTIRNHA